MARQFGHLADVEAFLAAVDKGSMSAAAVALSTTPSVISRAVSRLEAKLGAQLLRRSTRQLSLTEAGRLYLERTRAAFEAILEIERDIQGGPTGPLAGTVRMSVPTTYGHFRLPGMLPRFTARHPQVKLELSIANRNVDLVAEGYDLAIRLGVLPDSDLTCRVLEHARLKLVASPGYLAEHGTPSCLDDLSAHRLLPFVMPSTGRYGPWLLRVADRPTEWTPRGAIRVFDDVLGCVSLAIAGGGICQSYEFVVENAIADGRLVEVLPALNGCTRPFSLIFAAHRNLSAATRRLIDFLFRSASAIDAEKLESLGVQS